MSDLHKLLPCPFCGKPARACGSDGKNIGCKDIDCPAFCLPATPTEWNRRAALAEPQPTEADIDRGCANATARMEAIRAKKNVAQSAPEPVAQDRMCEVGAQVTHDNSPDKDRTFGDLPAATAPDAGITVAPISDHLRILSARLSEHLSPAEKSELECAAIALTALDADSVRVQKDDIVQSARYWSLSANAVKDNREYREAFERFRDEILSLATAEERNEFQRAMDIYPDRLEHHEAKAEEIRTGRRKP